jgi:hypothetical protein
MAGRQAGRKSPRKSHSARPRRLLVLVQVNSQALAAPPPSSLDPGGEEGDPTVGLGVERSASCVGPGQG